MKYYSDEDLERELTRTRSELAAREEDIEGRMGTAGRPVGTPTPRNDA